MINHIGMINHGGQGHLDSGFSTNISSQEILRMSRLGVSVCPMYWGGLGSSPCGSFGAPEEALQMLKDMQGARLTEPWMVVVGYISIHF